MHVYKLEADNMHLHKQVKELSDQAAEVEARFKADTAKLQDGTFNLFHLFS